MFAAHCRHCDAKVLLSDRRMTGVRNTPAGIEVDFLCWCGTTNTWRSGKQQVHAGAA